MLTTVMISIAVFIGVVAGIMAAAMFLRDKSVLQMEDRLSTLTGKNEKVEPGGLSKVAQMLAKEKEGKSPLDAVLAKWFNLTLLFEQAQVERNMVAFLGTSIGLGVGAGMLCGFAGLNLIFAPIIGVMFSGIPFCWLLFRRKRRLAKFAAQLPEALELVARALRAGHSLAAGFHLVGQEGSDPVAGEFNRVFEAQNLGIPFEESLESLTIRVPNLDLKFFVTAVILQRQTGGDLAEILDKIGHLIRERFQIWVQVQALTGEGRLSGIVLLALPPLLFVTVYRMNPDYIQLLFTDDLGKKMLIAGVLSQLFGALVIRKIVNIRV